MPVTLPIKEDIIMMKYQDGTLTYTEMLKQIKELYFTKGYNQAIKDNEERITDVY